MDAISQIKQNLNIVDIIGNYIELKKAGNNYKALCPFHNENTPSFMVSPDLQIFKCFGCGEGGDIFGFVQKIEGIDFPKALELMAEKAGVKLEKQIYDPDASKKNKIFEINSLATTFFHRLLVDHKAGTEALKYLKDNRKLKTQTIKDFNLGYAPNTWDTLYRFLNKKGYADEDILAAGLITEKRGQQGYVDKFHDRIMFPFTGIDGKILGFTGRSLHNQEPKYFNTPETLIFKKNALIYGLERARVEIKNSGVVMVEGQMDVVSSHQAGISNVVAATGTSLTINQLKILERYTQDLTLCFDSDTAGQAAILRSIELAEKENFNIKVAILPEDYKDLDELVIKEPKTAQKILKSAIPIYDFFISTAMKRNDIKSAIGKKKIIHEVVPKLTKIKDKVMLDHYVKLLIKETETNEETIRSIIIEAQNRESNELARFIDEKVKTTFVKSAAKENRHVTEEYILALLFHEQDLEFAQNILYKLGKNDFQNEDLRELFAYLKAFILGRKRKFKVDKFSAKLSPELQKLTETLYLTDLGALAENQEKFEKELETSLKRLKKDTITRELTELKEKLEQAELQQDVKDLELLSKKVYKFSKLKNQYD